MAVEKSPVEVTFAVGRPVDPALPADGAVDQGDDAFGQPGQLVGLKVGPEGDSGHVERRVPGAAGQLVLEADVGDFSARVGLAQVPVART